MTNGDQSMQLMVDSDSSCFSTPIKLEAKDEETERPVVTVRPFGNIDDCESAVPTQHQTDDSVRSDIDSLSGKGDVVVKDEEETACASPKK